MARWKTRNISLKDHNHDHVEYVTTQERSRMLIDKEAVMQCVKCRAVDENADCVSDSDRHEFNLVRNQMDSASDESDAAITVSDMRSNVGMGKHSEVRRAQRKIKAWPLPSLDVRTVTVVPREALGLV